jgi:hypothetical protein
MSITIGLGAAERRARAYAAQALLNDPTHQAAWDEIETELRETWENCLFSRKRDRIWTELRTVRKLRQKLASFAGNARD